jgi:putative glutathione S-transferase
MGLLVEGVWRDTEQGATTGGRFRRHESAFRNWVTPDGSPGPTGTGGFAAEPGRYHLYVAYFCPWAHRTLIMRELKGLTGIVGLSVANWLMRENGITFEPAPGVRPDPVLGATYLYQIYQAALPGYTGRVTVPVLLDTRTRTIVSNESADILRMFNSAFDGVGARQGDYYPVALRPEIDAVNARVYDTLSNGVYKAGFATSQSAHEDAVEPLFETLDWLEARLATRRYLCGGVLTEADIRLLPTLLRFDLVYVGHFKCNRRRIVDYPALWGYTRDLYQTGRIASTFVAEHAKRHYYQSHLHINPTGVVPVGPDLDFDTPHDRAGLP